MNAIEKAKEALDIALGRTGVFNPPELDLMCEAYEALQSLEGEAEKEAEELIIQRDYWEEKATELAMDVGEHFDVDVGEHSSDNCPVLTAIDYMANHTTPKPPAVPGDVARALVNLVEGVGCRRWQDEYGNRLKDTEEWVVFYCANAAAQQEDKS